MLASGSLRLSNDRLPKVAGLPARRAEIMAMARNYRRLGTPSGDRSQWINWQLVRDGRTTVMSGCYLQVTLGLSFANSRQAVCCFVVGC